ALTRGSRLSATPVAVAEVISGSVSVRMEAHGAEAAAAIGVADQLGAGSTIVTAEDGRAAFRLADGQSLRLDYRSRARLLSTGTVELTRGALYVDSDARSAGGSHLEIRTPFGIVRDFGTQFEVRIVEDRLQVRVREGSVVLDQGNLTLEAGPGEAFEVDERGRRSTSAVPLYGEPWNWSLSVSPPYELEGKSLEDFLRVVARETGWRLEYAHPEIGASADQVILHGDLDTMGIESALPSVLETCGLVHHAADGVLRIDYEEAS
ncbi:MAG: FecR family protein, partial [Thermoanaerobaculia bacterium]|nr:FecR family protein [Thermoanaerobaculia bacterium]